MPNTLPGDTAPKKAKKKDVKPVKTAADAKKVTAKALRGPKTRPRVAARSRQAQAKADRHPKGPVARGVRAAMNKAKGLTPKEKKAKEERQHAKSVAKHKERRAKVESRGGDKISYGARSKPGVATTVNDEDDANDTAYGAPDKGAGAGGGKGKRRRRKPLQKARKMKKKGPKAGPHPSKAKLARQHKKAAAKIRANRAAKTRPRRRK